jgi:cobalt transporter subunit CbtB
MTTIASQAGIAGTVSVAGRWPAFLALFLGAIFVFGTGFSHVSAVHNAAHDARHAAGFPCH